MHNTGRLHRQLRPLLLQVRPGHQAGPVVRHQGHHLQEVRPHVSRTSSQEIYDAEYKEKFEAAGHRVLLHPHRRRGGPSHPLRGRLHLGLQELRRRRDERHGVHRLRLPGHDDLRAGQPPTATTSTRPPTAPCTRHYYKHLKGEETSTNSDGHHLRLDRRSAQARRAGQHPRADGLRRQAGKGHPGHHRRRAK